MEKLKTYFAESWDEIKNKVTWSKYSELQSSAILVLVASTLFALVIGAIDWVFKTGLQIYYKGEF
ncbi:preprotein translocase subunit SecE [Parachryseolinea silvisoli]|jgi:preprotein translocase subunit SecE|uniref:preprotein translocase subunit SecE n=1 Tax=Parachryseolinea silvisoli TaxID=2873601 RepID=UPI002265F89A|nr:preprotein translocase subunit SecE [Parachryseolinea silvisoli]MCD9019527.1 preprotein translocase subunit SecE [Parachryseolinea silvisoli]